MDQRLIPLLKRLVEIKRKIMKQELLKLWEEYCDICLEEEFDQIDKNLRNIGGLQDWLLRKITLYDFFEWLKTKED